MQCVARQRTREQVVDEHRRVDLAQLGTVYIGTNSACVLQDVALNDIGTDGCTCGVCSRSCEHQDGTSYSQMPWYRYLSHAASASYSCVVMTWCRRTWQCTPCDAMPIGSKLAICCSETRGYVVQCCGRSYAMIWRCRTVATCCTCRLCSTVKVSRPAVLLFIDQVSLNLTKLNTPCLHAALQ